MLAVVFFVVVLSFLAGAKTMFGFVKWGWEDKSGALGEWLVAVLLLLLVIGLTVGVNLIAKAIPVICTR